MLMFILVMMILYLSCGSAESGDAPSAVVCDVDCFHVNEFRGDRCIRCSISEPPRGSNGSHACLISRLPEEPMPSKMPWRMELHCPRKILKIRIDVNATDTDGDDTKLPDVYLLVTRCQIEWTSVVSLAKRLNIRGISFEDTIPTVATLNGGWDYYGGDGDNAPAVTHDQVSANPQNHNNRVDDDSGNNTFTYSSSDHVVRVLTVIFVEIRLRKTGLKPKSSPMLPFHQLTPNVRMLSLEGTLGIGKSGFAKEIIHNLAKLRVLVLDGLDATDVESCITFPTSPESDHDFVPDNVFYGFMSEKIQSDRPLATLPYALIIRSSNVSVFPSKTLSTYTQVLSLRVNIINDVSFLSSKTSRFGSLLNLDVSKNRIKNFAGFHKVSRLESLNLSYNKLRAIFSRMCVGLSRLRYINLSHNRIHLVESKCFRHMRSLDTIDLRNNELTEFIPRHAHLLQSIYLQHNKIRKIPYYVWFLRRLSHIDLSYNELKTLAIPQDMTFTSNTSNNLQMLEMNLSYNSIDITSLISVDERYMALLRLVRVSFKNNKLDCDCRARQLRNVLRSIYKCQYSEYSLNALDTTYKCTSPGSLKGRLLHLVSIDDLLCQIRSKECPHDCKCYQRAPHYIMVICGGVRSRNRKIYQPKSVPGNTRELVMSNGRLDSLVAEEYFRNLSVLDVSNASLTEIPASFFNLIKAMKLNLSNNRIQRLPKSLQQAKLDELYLSNNEIQCDCYNKWLIDWMQKNRDLISDIGQIYCHGVGRFENVSILDVETNDLCNHLIFLVTVGVGVPLTIIMIVVIIARIIYVNRWTLRIRWLQYRHKCNKDDIYEPQEDELKYDAFISYSTQDTNWMNEIKKRLEHYHRPYELCVSERDFVPGVPLVEQIVDNMYNSRRAIFIVSEEFLKNDRCRFAIEVGTGRYVLSNQDYMVLILFPGVDLKTIRRHRNGRTYWLERLVEAGEYIDAEDPHLWEKLFLAMPRNRVRRPGGQPEKIAMIEHGQPEKTAMIEENDTEQAILLSEMNTV